MSNIIPILIFLIILGIVIFIHELGHFIFAGRAGVFVEEFALGMGPKLFSFKGKKESQAPNPETGEPEFTVFSLRAFPIGGFCKMRGQDGDVPDDPEAFNSKPVRKRILVIAGGSIMNFILAFVLFFVVLFLRGFPVSEVYRISEDMPGYQAGLRVGDRITHINGTRVVLFEAFRFVLDTSQGEELNLRVIRGGERLDLAVTPVFIQGGYRIGFNQSMRLGLVFPRVAEGVEVPFSTVTFGEVLSMSSEMLLFQVQSPFMLIRRLFIGQGVPEGGGVMGPIGLGGAVTNVYHDAMEAGLLFTIVTMLFITGIISAALGTMNLLPIPALDGARLVFLFIEGIRRKPIPADREAVVHVVGIVALLLLAVFIAYQDIMRLINV